VLEQRRLVHVLPTPRQEEHNVRDQEGPR
jgi:hypothetical protein